MRNLPTLSSDIQPRSVALAITVHLVLGGLLWWGASWVQPKPTEAELWDAAALGAALNQQPVTQTEPQPIVNETTPKVVQSKETIEPAEIETKSQTQKPVEKAAVTDPKVTPKPQPNKSSQPVQKQNTTDNSTRNAILNNAGKPTGVTGGSKSSGMDAGYVAKVKSMIESRGRNQGLSNASGSVSFRVAPNGSISGVSASITPADKKAVLEGIIRSISLPRPVPDEAMSKGMRFSVRF